MKWIIIAIVLVAVLAFWFMGRRGSGGFHGAIGFRTAHPTELAEAQLSGFSEPIVVRTLQQGEHSFNYPGRQVIPAEVQIRWRLVSDSADRTQTVALTGVPADAPGTSALWFVLSPAGVWSAEYASQLDVQ